MENADHKKTQINIDYKNIQAEAKLPVVEVSYNFGEQSILYDSFFHRAFENIEPKEISLKNFSKYLEDSYSKSDIIELNLYKFAVENTSTADSMSYIVSFSRVFQEDIKNPDILSIISYKNLNDTSISTDFVINHSNKYLEDIQSSSDSYYIGLSKVSVDYSLQADIFSTTAVFNRSFEDIMYNSEMYYFTTNKVFVENKTVSEARVAHKQNYFAPGYVELSYAGEYYTI